ncbi:hydroxyacylglutathione hydrolase [Candidatus Aalborgicola defluviihabitans]|jgi:hydroxyacylglutathione hydrolase|uniref:hydroxyacylglutathione hydrolase n=1 Tax=Candidatus Aalborgicola defluviihabitans TaxID=3386187 RepID=UPI001D68E3B1|nr:hydroxyacylglutathione hydrolase [Burkholderiales bacterium]MBK7313352.1 hydroxyacylglutathione hydrolase [Burkholderiales bacterium]MBL0244625.1 hydroxyacylglutathione hydrolase [Rhodoferax sp.]
MKLIPLPAFDDNYIWLLHDGQRALVVDPGDAQPVLQALQREGVQLQSILVTHHHGDHTGGVAALRDATGAVVFGPARETMPEPLTRLCGGDNVQAMGLNIAVLDVPGHTAGHIAYFCQPAGESPLLFCGDTLFSGGCGRLFEGTPEQMLASLEQLAALPGATRVCCAHEYTLGNLKFALEVDPDNAQLVAYTTTCRTRREQGQPTLPSTIDTERQINPFLRSNHPSIQTSVRRFDAQGAQQQGIFATLRQWKNQYR